MNKEIHGFTLFLHLLCHKLAVSEASKGRRFHNMAKTALEIAKRWGWSEQTAHLLYDDLCCYFQSKQPFAGGMKDRLDWWENLPVSTEKHLLKAMAIVLLSIVPHTAEIKRLFSALGSTQSAYQCNLATDTFEVLAKLRGYYCYQLWLQDRAMEKSTH
jgi:hypothetical protein